MRAAPSRSAGDDTMPETDIDIAAESSRATGTIL
jgi:hypothetical protein